MEQAFVPSVAAVTAVAAYFVGVAALRRSHQALRIALRRTCELLGLSVIFLILNLIIGVTIVVVGRSVTPLFCPPIYSTIFQLPYCRCFKASCSGSGRRNDIVSSPRPARRTKVLATTGREAVRASTQA
jgi:hypothetical protein